MCGCEITIRQMWGVGSGEGAPHSTFSPPNHQPHKKGNKEKEKLFHLQLNAKGHWFFRGKKEQKEGWGESCNENGKRRDHAHSLFLSVLFLKSFLSSLLPPPNLLSLSLLP